ncbi:MAG: hypothetical protein ACU83U_08450 [Gammaproteobacteria bacterium]
MNPLNFIQKELYAAWFEATNPLFTDNSANDVFYADQFNYYHSLKGKVIDTNSGESLFQQQSIAPIPTKAQCKKQSEAPASTGFLMRNWKTA